MVFDVKRLDIYRKVPKDLTQPTYTGALVSVACIVFMSFLFVSELWRFLAVEVNSELFVHDPKDDGRIAVQLNATLPQMSCEYLGIDIQDDLGRHDVGFVENTKKTPVGQGCLFETKFYINKVPGNFHISTHSAKQQPDVYNMHHVINSLIFGEDLKELKEHGTFDPLKNKENVKTDPQASHDYVLRIVPSIYEHIGGNKKFSYQFTWAHRDYMQWHHSGKVIPSIWFRYDLSPITVKYTEKRPPFYSFLTTVCAIVGGTFTVAGIIDSLIFSASEFYKKFEIGKLS